MENIKQILKNFFLDEKIVLSIIILNAIAIFLKESGFNYNWLVVLDLACTFFFIVEMVVKLSVYSWKGYWKEGWNRLDGILVIISIPSVIVFFYPMSLSNLSFILVLRLLRVLRFLRVLHFFPNFSKIVAGFKLAMRESRGVLFSFLVIIVIVGMVNCSLFSKANPEYFSTPLRSIYSVFQICTVDGWYEIPNSVAEYYGSSTWIASCVRVYFCFLLILGGILGMSLINSVFVDAMVSDNNDDLRLKLDEIEQKINKLLEEKE